MQGQLPSIGKASKKKEIIKNLDKYFLQIQVCSPLDWCVVPGIAARESGGCRGLTRATYILCIELSLTWTRICLIGRVEVRIAREGARRSNFRAAENCITSGSPLCRGLTRATYILCIEHPRPKRESNPGPPALQANTLCKEPFERRC